MAERATTKHNIQRDEENIITPNYSVVTNIVVSGTYLQMLYSGVDVGTGEITLLVTGTTIGPQTLANLIALADSKNPPAGADAVPIADTQAGNSLKRVTFTNLRTFYRQTYDQAYLPIQGWITGSNSWSCISTDAPIYNVLINANVTGTIGIGNRILLNQSGQNKFFLVHGVAITGSNTYLNLYGGTDYSLVSGGFANQAYSPIKEPFGFPLNPAKWTETATDTGNAAKASPTANTWYGGTGLSPTGISIIAPIGVWNVNIKALVEVQTPATQQSYGVRWTFSTANNSESDATWTNQGLGMQPAVLGFMRWPAVVNKLLTLASKTTYYLNILTGQTSVISINVRGDIATTTIELVCAYL